MKPELLYSELEVGRTFEPFTFHLTETLVNEYRTALGVWPQSVEESESEGREIAPAGLWGIWGRQAYLRDYTMPGGGILVGQDMEFSAPVFVGDVLNVQATVIEKYENHERKYITIESTAKIDHKLTCGVVRVKAIWPR
ncbi:MAG: hypothetical protein QF530_10030 [SAR202 cluster bacterium]|jgi:acyl dehydratase|nr:hypothetical protein [SAR202 cluster bacterium]DAC36940.1 MAG TPA: hypothetical protein D7H79_00275 [Candidatus Poseidoniales archaeon]|tara:strand:+ start:2818 stop:3234 length:417 start_codon:yes stop_codon:yes gene_type:complete